MTQEQLINKAATLINQASRQCGAGTHEEATASLNELRDLLNNPASFEAGEEKSDAPEQKQT